MTTGWKGWAARLVGAFSLLSTVLAAPGVAGDAPQSIVSLLRSQTPSKSCGRQVSALRGTLARLTEMSIPTDGRLILVNIASRTLAAYENGAPVIESRVVIGREGWRTPDLMTTAEYVRNNPTWTVPESIVKESHWRSKLAQDPDYFARNGFDVLVHGKAVDPWDLRSDEVAGATFVQRPSKRNALGRVKIGLVNSGGIYLHDTNDKAAYERQGVESHGCIRVEKAMELAGWVIGKSKDEMQEMLKGGDKENHKPETPVRVVVGYFTAWPDAEGKVHFYRDIYNRDPRGPSCAPVDRDEIESPYGKEGGSSRASYNPDQDQPPDPDQDQDQSDQRGD